LESATATAKLSSDYDSKLLSRKAISDLVEGIKECKKEIRKNQELLKECPKGKGFGAVSERHTVLQANVKYEQDQQRYKETLYMAELIGAIEDQDFYKEAVEHGFETVIPGAIVDFLQDGEFYSYLLVGECETWSRQELRDKSELAIFFYTEVGKLLLGRRKDEVVTFKKGLNKVGEIKILAIEQGL
jgi:transcription elongation GreA/GreB family factor